jgi:hypothetical protein
VEIEILIENATKPAAAVAVKKPDMCKMCIFNSKGNELNEL